MFNPTPGPWEVDSGECLKVRNDSGSIAMIMQTHLRGRRGNDETHANARLIAAAPDLLDALKDAVAKLEKDARDTATAFGITEWRKTAPHTAEITSRARAALKEPDT